MKIVLILLFVVACSSGSPASTAVDWEAVTASVGGLRVIISQTCDQLRSLAQLNSLDLDCLSIIDRGCLEMENILREIEAEIEDGTLTSENLQAYASRMKGVVAGVQADLWPCLENLPPREAARFRDIMYAIFAQIEIRFQELYALLGQ